MKICSAIRNLTLAIQMTVLSTSCGSTKFSGFGGMNESKESKPAASIETLPVTACNFSSATVSPGKSVDLELVGFASSSTVTVQDSFGSASINGSTVTYTAPASVPSARDVILTFNDGAKSSTCTLKLIGDGQVIIPDDGKTRGLKATVYQLAANSKSMFEDFDGKGIPPIPGDYLIPNIEFSGACTGASAVVGPITISSLADFVISFAGKLNIPVDGDYTFLVGADDGAKMWLDGNPTPVLNLDGYARDSSGNLLRNASGNPYRPAGSDINSAKVTLKKGAIPFKLNYWQGPCGGYGAMLYWTKPGDAARSIIPASAFDRP